MTVLALEIRDDGLHVAGPAGDGVRPPAPSPGFALVDGDRVLTGAAARDAACLNPPRVSTRFWSELSANPLPRPFPEDLSPADLAHAHLSSFWAELPASGIAIDRIEDVLLVIPGSFSATQLGLVVGIARACSIPVTGLVDAAVAATAAHPPETATPVLLHVDMELHRAVVTEIFRDGAELHRGAVEVVPGVGLLGLHDRWLRAAADLFVQRTRFDPLHSAGAEQHLDRRLHEAVSRLCDSDTVLLDADAGGRTVSVDLRRDTLTAAADETYQVLIEAVRRRARADMAVLFSHRVAGLPGLTSLLGTRLEPVPALALPAEAATGGALAARARIRGDGDTLPWVVSLPSAT